jgi:hypothetical protein
MTLLDSRGYHPGMDEGTILANGIDEVLEWLRARYTEDEIDDIIGGARDGGCRLEESKVCWEPGRYWIEYREPYPDVPDTEEARGSEDEFLTLSRPGPSRPSP